MVRKIGVIQAAQKAAGHIHALACPRNALKILVV